MCIVNQGRGLLGTKLAFRLLGVDFKTVTVVYCALESPELKGSHCKL